MALYYIRIVMGNENQSYGTRDAAIVAAKQEYSVT